MDRFAAAAHEKIHGVEHQQQNDGRPAQLVGAVAPVHEAGKCVAQFLEETHSAASISMPVFICIILQEKTRQVKGNFTKFTNLLRIIPAAELYFRGLKW